MEDVLIIDDKHIKISNPKKYLWCNSNYQVDKVTYITYIHNAAEYILKYSKDRLLTTIRYPNGVTGKHFYQKNAPSFAPEWIQTIVWNDTNYILANDTATLVWLANLACLELHVSFNYWQHEDYPTELVFDLDPTDTSNFMHVLQMASYMKEVLLEVGLIAYPKTSGATGLQLYIPILQKYTYDDTRKVAKFIAEYIQQKYPKDITLERLVKNRGNKLYVDYLQHWRGKTLPAPYSVRAREKPSVSTPVSWNEIEKNSFKPDDFTIFNILDRINKVGDLFDLTSKQSLDHILEIITDI